ncbi:MAG: type II toxin-antitoxin system prevent-host-death family antitoxin [Pseudomonadota bacterium]
MRVASFSDFRKNLAAMMDAVNDDHAPLIVTRNGGKPAAVLISLEDYASLQETDYLLRSPKNAARLREGIAEFEAGGGSVRDLIE